MKRALTLSAELQRVDKATPEQGIAKHRKMASSPFVFFRGSAQLFYADIANGTLPVPDPLLKLPMTTVMGDCHASNFGFLTEEGSHGDNVIFAPNDFDDACMGHAIWDLLRFSTSLILVAEHCQALSSGENPGDGTKKGKVAVTTQDARDAIAGFLRGYLSICQMGIEGAAHLGITLQHFESPSALNKGYLKACKRASGGEMFHVKSALAKSVKADKVPLIFASNAEKFVTLPKTLYKALQHAFSPYMDDKILDIVERVNAGTGSVNMQRYYFLVGPQDYRNVEDLHLCHLVEVKQQREAAALHYFPELHPANRLNPAHLTAMCQRRMQNKPDLVLDEAVWEDKHWLIRSRHHAKVGIAPEDIGMGKRNVNDGGLVDYAISCGKALALAHCRGDRRSVRFENAVCTELPQNICDITSIAEVYAAQVVKDCAWLRSHYA